MIPKVIHYCWFGKQPLPKSVKANIDSWKKNCPDYTIVQWNEDNFDVNKYSFTKEAYDNKQWAFVSDVARLDIIYNHGGIYFDTDVKMLRNISSVLSCACFLSREDRFFVNTGIGFGSIKYNQFILENLMQYHNKHFVNKNGSFNKITCVDVTTNLLYEMGLRPSNKICVIGGIKIYPSSYFCPIKYGSNSRKISKTAFTIHNYTASWKNEDDKEKNNYISITVKKYIKYYLDRFGGFGTYNRIKKIIKRE